jgi:hypothetical protein
MSSALEAKIVVLGAQGVGKTSLVMRYCKGAFDSSQVTSTVGASFMTKRVVDSDTDTVVRLQIWDTGIVALPLTLLTCNYTYKSQQPRQHTNNMLTKVGFHASSRPGTLPVHLASLLSRRKCLHPLLLHHRLPELHRHGTVAYRTTSQPTP